MTASHAAAPLVLLGAGGHAKVLLALARAARRPVEGVCDPCLAAEGARAWNDVAVLGGDEALERLAPGAVGLILGIGQVIGSDRRAQVYARCKAAGFTFPALVHPAAWVDPTAQLGQGVQVMAGAIVQPDCTIGENTIINTRASVDHDCVVGSDVHVAPGATLCGNVHVEPEAFVGSGATVLRGIRIGRGAVLGAGATLVRDLPAGACATGSPARLRPGPVRTRGGRDDA